MTKYIEPFAKKFRGDEFGNLAPYREGRPHRGQDWHPKDGSLIPAITNGSIKANAWSDGLGWYVVQSTSDKLFVLYAHLKAQSGRTVGTYIHAGEPIGKVGNTGEFSTGSHLHLSIGKKVNVASIPYALLIDPLKHIESNK
jgi:murein DD-endopeptidase MepM/ murein hydrolase activator NlpD